MKKKIALFAAAGMLTTATIVYATVATNKKETKKEIVKKETKTNKATKRNCGGYFRSI